MSVHDGLARCETVIKADVETVRLQAGEKALTNFGDQLPNPLLFGDAEFVDAANVLARNHEGMAIRYGVLVRHCDRMLGLYPEPFERQGAERTGRHLQSITAINRRRKG